MLLLLCYYDMNCNLITYFLLNLKFFKQYHLLPFTDDNIFYGQITSR